MATYYRMQLSIEEIALVADMLEQAITVGRINVEELDETKFPYLYTKMRNQMLKADYGLVKPSRVATQESKQSDTSQQSKQAVQRLAFDHYIKNEGDVDTEVAENAARYYANNTARATNELNIAEMEDKVSDLSSLSFQLMLKDNQVNAGDL